MRLEEACVRSVMRENDRVAFDLVVMADNAVAWDIVEGHKGSKVKVAFVIFCEDLTTNLVILVVVVSLINQQRVAAVVRVVSINYCY